MILESVFWTSILAMGYAYAGYPLLVALRARLTPRPTDDLGPAPEGCTFLLVAHNEEARIGSRLENLIATRPHAGCPVVVVCDGCTDATAAKARQHAADGVQVIEVAERSGKAACLNRGFAAIPGGIVVLADARQRFLPTTVPVLLSVFRDPRVAAATGNLEIEASAAGAGRGVDLYWRLERFVRHQESVFDSCVGVTGAVYALRREAFQPLPEDTILDDVLIPMQAVVAGGRVVFLREAVAHDPQELAPEAERRRKRRTLAGNFQLLFRYPGWLLPWRNRLWWQLASHKYLRLPGPLFLALALASSAAQALRSPFFLAAAVGIGSLIALGLAGLALRGVRRKILTVPAGFLLLQWTCVLAFAEYLRMRRGSGAGAAWK